MKRLIILFMAVILSALLLVGCGPDQNAGTITELQTMADNLQSRGEEYSALKTELDSANSTIAELQSQIDALTAERAERSGASGEIG